MNTIIKEMSLWALACLFVIGVAVGPVVGLSSIERGDMIGSSNDCDPPSDPDENDPKDPNADSMPTEVHG